MKHILTATARLTVLALILTTTLDAQRITRRESHGEVRNSVNVSTVVAAIDNAARVTARLNGIGILTNDRIRVIDVRPYIAASRRAAYRSSLENNQDRIEDMRAALVTMDPVVRVLADRKITVDAVVAAGILDVMETGKSSNVLVLYVDSSNQIGMSSSTSRSLMSFRPTPSGVMSALYVSPEMVARVSALESVRIDRVRFYDIDAILKPTDKDTYEAAVRRNNTAIRSLRVELSKRPPVMQAMARHDGKLLIGDIYAADLIGDDDVLVLYYKRTTDTADSGPPNAR
jgi:hypothetical protein